MNDLFFFLIAFGAEVAGTVAGFGSSTIALPLSLFLFDFQTALVLVTFLHIFGHLVRAAFFRRGLSLRLAMFFGIPSVALTIVGASLVAYAPQNVLKLILGLFLLLFGIVSLLKPDLRFPPTGTSAIIGGSFSGFFAGLIGTGGALRGSFLIAFNLEKSVYVATAALIALAVDITRLPVYFASGFLAPQYYWYIPILLGVALAGSFAGRRIVERVPQEAFRNIVFIAIALIGTKFISDF